MDNIENELFEALERRDSSAYEMATVGYFQEKKGNKPKGELIRVFTTSDSDRPQVHVHLKSLNGGLLSCIKLDKPEYFLHDVYQDKLSTEQIEALIDFFNSKPSAPEFVLNDILYKLHNQWDYTVIQWNLENINCPKICLPIGLGKDGYIITPQMPDYTQLK